MNPTNFCQTLFLFFITIYKDVDSLSQIMAYKYHCMLPDIALWSSLTKCNKRCVLSISDAMRPDYFGKNKPHQFFDYLIIGEKAFYIIYIG